MSFKTINQTHSSIFQLTHQPCSFFNSRSQRLTVPHDAAAPSTAQMIALGSVMCTFHHDLSLTSEIAAPILVPITAPDSTPHCTKNIITPTDILPLAQPVNVADTVMPVNRATNKANRRTQANRIAQHTTTAMTTTTARTSNKRKMFGPSF